MIINELRETIMQREKCASTPTMENASWCFVAIMEMTKSTNPLTFFLFARATRGSSLLSCANLKLARSYENTHVILIVN